MKWIGLHGHGQLTLWFEELSIAVTASPRSQATLPPTPPYLSFLATAEEMSPLHTPVAFAFPAGGEDRAADPSSGHFGEVSPEEPKEPWTVVSLGPTHTRVPSLVLMGSRWAVFPFQASQEKWQVPV